MSLRDRILSDVLTIREEAEEFLTDTCNIRRKTGETVIDGQNVITYDDPVETACRLIIRSGSESANVASQERLVAQTTFTGLFKMQLPYGTEVTEDDHIEYTDQVTSQVRTFEIIYAPPFNAMTGAYVVSLHEVF